MAASDSELLDLAREALKIRLQGDAWEGYSEGTFQFRGASIKDLHTIIKDLERAANSGGARPVRAYARS